MLAAHAERLQAQQRSVRRAQLVAAAAVVALVVVVWLVLFG